MNRFKKTNYLYDWISCVIPDRVYFGPLPNEYMLEQLKEKKFSLIVNITESSYESEFRTLHYPIVDNSIPENIFDYCKFIVQLKREYESEKKIYIHCLAGHSRSSMVIVSLLFCIYNEELKDIINKVIGFHRNRVRLREVWQYRSPFNYKQFMFLCMIHKNIYVNIGGDSKMYNWLSPKNIWLNPSITLNECANAGMSDTDLFNLIKNDQHLLQKIKKTFLKKLSFINENKENDTFYDRFFKSVREKII